MASHFKILASVLLAVLCLSLAAYAEDATPPSANTGPTKYGVKEEPKAETAPVPAAPAAPVAPTAPAAPAKVTTENIPVVNAPANGRLVILDGKPVYVDEKFNIIGQPAAGQDGANAANDASTGSATDADREARRKETAALAAKMEEENKIKGAIRRLGTSGWRVAQSDLIGFGKDSIPYLIDAMQNVDDKGNPLPSNYQEGGHYKAETGRATRNRTRVDIISELLTEIVTTHSTYKGEDLPTFSQQDWQTWWVANGDKISIGK